jgi:1,4-alpha-glucan branching enzyme
MPVNEYPFDGSWGYQVTGFYAITSRFGAPQDFMYFVDTMHRAGIGVIVDWVPSGFPKDAHGPARFDGTWLYEHKNPIRREHPHWGTNSLNYARPEVVSFLVSSAMLLMDKYHLDGIRADAVSSILYLDYGRTEYVPNKDGGNIDLDAVEFLRKFNKAVLGGYPGALTVAEESTAFPLVTKPPETGGLGFMFKWNMGFMNDTLNYMSTDPYFRHGNHDRMTFSMNYAFSENYILAYSHDEVVHGKASLIGKMAGDYDGKFASLRALFGWLIAHPGKKLMFMGDEFAQFIEWDYKRELDWALLGYDKHRGMKDWVAALNALYAGRKALHAADGGWDGFTWLNVEDRKNSVFAFLRSYDPGEDGRADFIVCVFNFTPVAHRSYDVALPEAGTLTLLLDSNDERYGGAPPGVNDDAAPAPAKKRAVARTRGLNGMPRSATLSVPPLCAMYYAFKVTTQRSRDLCGFREPTSGLDPNSVKTIATAT